jgi:hypothetical protein
MKPNGFAYSIVKKKPVISILKKFHPIYLRIKTSPADKGISVLMVVRRQTSFRRSG